MRVLVTGDRGFIGTATKKYIQEHWKTLSDDGKNDAIEIIGFDLQDDWDIRDIDSLTDRFKETKPDRILHLAAIARFAEADADPILAFETNWLGTKNVVRVANSFDIPLVYASTGSCYMPIENDPPINERFPIKGNSNYGCSKALGEKEVMKHFQYIILRYAHLYGRLKVGHGLIGGYLERINRGMAPTLYGGAQSNDFCYETDVAEANYLALLATDSKWNEVYNIGTGEELSAESAGEMVIRVWNEFNPDKRFEGEVEKKEQRTVDPSRFVYNTSKAERMLGFKAKVKFEDGLRDMFSQDGNERTNK